MLKITFNSLLLLYPLGLILLIFIILLTFNYKTRFLFETKNIFHLSMVFIVFTCYSIKRIPCFETVYFTFHNINLFLLTLIFLFMCLTCFFMYKIVFIMEELIILISILFISIFAISANNLISLFICFESLNICFFILILTGSNDKRSIEAALKYVFVSIIASLCFLMGIFFIYLTCMSFSYKDIALYLSYSKLYSIELELFVGFFFITTTFFIKLGIFPFYNWLVEVYSDLTLQPLILVSTLLKFVFTLMFLSLFTQINLIFALKLNLFLFIGGLGSLIVSCFFLLIETKIKKNIALISLMSNGFLLLFWCCPNTEVTYILSLSYISVQAITLIFTFGFLALLQFKKDLPISLSSLRNYSEINIVFLIFFICNILGLIGIPPFPGFFPKISMMYHIYINNCFVILFFFLFFTITSCVCFLRIILFISKTDDNLAIWTTLNQKYIFFLIFGFLLFNMYIIYIHYQLQTLL